MRETSKRIAGFFDSIIGFFSHWAWLVAMGVVVLLELFFQFCLAFADAACLPGSWFFPSQLAIGGPTVRGMLAVAVLIKFILAFFVCQLRTKDFSKSWTLLAVGFFLSALILQHGVLMFLAILLGAVAISCRIPPPEKDSGKVSRPAM